MSSELNGTGRMFRVSFSMPDLSESARLWREIGEEYPVDHLVKLEEFAGTVRMTPGQMRDVFERAMEIAVSEKSEAGGISGQMIKDACAVSGRRKAGREDNPCSAQIRLSGSGPAIGVAAVKRGVQSGEKPVSGL